MNPNAGVESIGKFLSFEARKHSTHVIDIKVKTPTLSPQPTRREGWGTRLIFSLTVSGFPQ
jgi:hypothetical protein